MIAIVAFVSWGCGQSIFYNEESRSIWMCCISPNTVCTFPKGEITAYTRTKSPADFYVGISLMAGIYHQRQAGTYLQMISWNRLFQMTQFHTQEPLQFARTSSKCSMKYLRISAYFVRSIAHFRNALIKAFIYSNLLTSIHKHFC